MATIWLPDSTTWPKNVMEFLGRAGSIFVDWCAATDEDAAYTEERHLAAVAKARRYDQAIYALNEELRPHSLIGFHCTRLVEGEIAKIENQGMSLPGSDHLGMRISALVASGHLTGEEAARLLSDNQADEEFRKGRLWFCFYEPRWAGQWGIEDLLRHWGGEALYNSHDRDDPMGPRLRGIGKPCVIEAVVPVATLSSVSGLSIELARAYAAGQAKPGQAMRFEACCMQALPAQSIRRIIQFDHPDFEHLTGWKEWSSPLTVS